MKADNFSAGFSLQIPIFDLNHRAKARVQHLENLGPGTEVRLQREPSAGFHDDPLDLVTLAHVDRLIRTPGPMHLEMILGHLRRHGLEFCDQPLQPVGILLTRRQYRIRRCHHHQIVDAEQFKAHGCDPEDYVRPADVAALLDDGWRIEINATRSRHVTGGAGSHHTHDVVLRARRLS